MVIDFSKKLAGAFYDTGGAAYNVEHPAYGALGDGVSDDRAAVQAADANGRACGSPGSVYLIGSNLRFINEWIPNGSLLRPANGVVLTFGKLPNIGFTQWIDLALGGSAIPLQAHIKSGWLGSLWSGVDQQGAFGAYYDITTELQNEINLANLTGYTEMPEGLAKISNITLLPEFALRGQGNAQTYLLGASGATGEMLADGGNGGKIVLENFYINGMAEGYTKILALGTHGVQLGTEAVIKNLFVLGGNAGDTTLPDITVHINGNVVDIEHLSVYRGKKLLVVDGVAVRLHGLTLAGASTVLPTDGFEVEFNALGWYVNGMEFEAPQSGGVPIKITRNGEGHGLVISLPQSGTYQHLIEIVGVSTDSIELTGVLPVNSQVPASTWDCMILHRSISSDDGIKFIRNIGLVNDNSFFYGPKRNNVVLLNEAYAASLTTGGARTLHVKFVHPSMTIMADNDITADCTVHLDIVDIRKTAGRRYKVINNSNFIIYVKLTSLGTARTINLTDQMIPGYSSTVGVPVQPGAVFEFEPSSQNTAGPYWATHSKPIYGSTTIDAPSLAAGAQQALGTVTVTNATIGMRATVTCSIALALTQIWAEVTASNTVTIYQRNGTGAPVDLGSATYKVQVIR